MGEKDIQTEHLLYTEARDKFGSTTERLYHLTSHDGKFTTDYFTADGKSNLGFALVKKLDERVMEVSLEPSEAGNEYDLLGLDGPQSVAARFDGRKGSFEPRYFRAEWADSIWKRCEYEWKADEKSDRSFAESSRSYASAVAEQVWRSVERIYNKEITRTQELLEKIVKI